MITPFRPFFLLVLVIFLFTWLGLVVIPWVWIGHMGPITQSDSADITPWDSSGAAHAGERIYAADGCVYCHTQQVRPANSGADLTRGWGTATAFGDDGKPFEVTRRSYPRDYTWQHQTFLGNNRDGADLSNVGQRFTSAAEIYRYLYNPQVRDVHSSMPSYRFLFVTRKIAGVPSDEALSLSGVDAPPPGFEVVPTDDARTLAAYLLSLKKDYHLADENGPVTIAPPQP